MSEIMVTNREAAKISALTSGKMDKCEHLIGETICYLIKIDSWIYLFSNRKVNWKLAKIIENQREKQRRAIEW